MKALWQRAATDVPKPKIKRHKRGRYFPSLFNLDNVSLFAVLFVKN